MPSTSHKQKKAACLALASKLGKFPVGKLHPSAKQMYDSLSVKQLSEFCREPVSE
uniref:Uncharacterized protein n=1 Tax=viral metagenome TaxID=1070528 RepID=A0A6M3LI94_9ZZZZ